MTILENFENIVKERNPTIEEISDVQYVIETQGKYYVSENTTVCIQYMDYNLYIDINRNKLYSNKNFSIEWVFNGNQAVICKNTTTEEKLDSNNWGEYQVHKHKILSWEASVKTRSRLGLELRFNSMCDFLMRVGDTSERGEENVWTYGGISLVIGKNNTKYIESPSGIVDWFDNFPEKGFTIKIRQNE